jgi:hypothetical protein
MWRGMPCTCNDTKAGVITLTTIFFGAYNPINYGESRSLWKESEALSMRSSGLVTPAPIAGVQLQLDFAI